MAGRKVGTIDHRGKPRVQTVNMGPSLTVQSDAHLADIEQILRTYGQEGQGLLDEAALQFADVSTFTDLQDAMNQAKVAEVQFMKLPSKVRQIFDHDVAVWLDTAHDKDKRDALVEAGFIKSAESVEESSSARSATGSEGETPSEPAAEGSSGGTE